MTILLTIIATADGDAGGSAIPSLALFGLMGLAMYFLIIRPNSKKRKQQIALQSALAVGDEVMTTSGIVGTITGEDGPNRFWLEIDDDVQVRIARGGIVGQLDADDASGGSDDADADDADTMTVKNTGASDDTTSGSSGTD